MSEKNIPYTEKELEIIALLALATSMFSELEPMHPGESKGWVIGISECHRVLMDRVVNRDYPNAFNLN